MEHEGLMSFGEDDGGSEVEMETLHGRNWPTVTQFSVFLENRVGQLMEVVRSFQGSKVKIVGLTISDSADCSILRLILSHPEQGREILAINKHAFAENELVAVELPPSPNALAELCMALLQAEINIHYAYPLIVHPRGRAAVAMHIDNNEQASRTLHEMGFDILCEADLAWCFVDACSGGPYEPEARARDVRGRRKSLRLRFRLVSDRPPPQTDSLVLS